MKSPSSKSLPGKIGWKDLRVPFDGHRLRRARAICLRRRDDELGMLTLASPHEHGYGWYPDPVRTGHSFEPDLKIRFSTTFFGGPGTKSGTMKDYPVFQQNQWGPDIIERSIKYPVLGLSVEESIFRTMASDYSWHTRWKRTAYRENAYRPGCPVQIQLILDSPRAFKVKWSSQGGTKLALQIEDHVGKSVSLAMLHEGWTLAGVLNGEEGLLEGINPSDDKAIGADLFSETPSLIPIADGMEISTRHVIISLCTIFGLNEFHEVSFAISPNDSSAAIGLLEEDGRKSEGKALANDWDKFLCAIPIPEPEIATNIEDQLTGCASSKAPGHYLNPDGARIDEGEEAESALPQPLERADIARTYAFNMWQMRVCERIDPIWGKTITESYTCFYSGTFAWSLPVFGWYARSHPDKCWKANIQNILEAYRQFQSDEGWLPNSVPLGHKPDPERKSQPYTQIPQYAWTVWQEYLSSEDKEWLATWYEPLNRLNSFMLARDRRNLNLGLWCQTHYYDGLDIFPTVDGLVIRGDKCLYSAVFAAEQVRFLDVLSRIAGELGFIEEAKVWRQKMGDARAAMEAHLWDEGRQWYGDVLASGVRETVVGLSGVFPAAYGLLPEDHDAAAIKRNLESLIVPYGVATVAPSDRRYAGRFFWRGPVWPASCLYGAGAARIYAPELLPRMAAASIRYSKAQPSIYECLEGHSGQVASYDEGMAVMPGIASVVGAYALCSTLRIAAGENLFALDH